MEEAEQVVSTQSRLGIARSRACSVRCVRLSLSNVRRLIAGSGRQAGGLRRHTRLRMVCVPHMELIWPKANRRAGLPTHIDNLVGGGNSKSRRLRSSVYLRRDDHSGTSHERISKRGLGASCEVARRTFEKKGYLMHCDSGCGLCEISLVQ